MGLVTQQDPIGIAGGLNLYGYANGDPVNFSDPFGLSPTCLAGAVGSVAHGFGLSRVTGSGYGVGSFIADAGLGCIGAGLGSKLSRLRQARALGAGAADAVTAGGTRALRAGDLGLDAVNQLDGTFSVADDLATVRIDMIDANISSPFSVIRNLEKVARDAGASSLRIEGRIGNERLYGILVRRYGLRSEGGLDVIDITLR